MFVCFCSVRFGADFGGRRLVHMNCIRTATCFLDILSCCSIFQCHAVKGVLHGLVRLFTRRARRYFDLGDSQKKTFGDSETSPESIHYF